MVDQLLRFWWAFELFSPQKIPDVSDSVKSWTARRPLPWAQPAALSDGWMWEYTVYLSVYRSAAIYRHLNAAFSPAEESFAPLRGGQTACAAFLVDGDGHLISNMVELSSAAWALGVIKRSQPVRVDTIPQLLGAFRDVNDQFGRDVAAAATQTADSNAPQRCPLDAVALERIADIVHDLVGGAGPSVATSEIRIKRSRIKVRTEPQERPKIDFLNSPYLRELETVRTAIRNGHVGRALLTYLRPDEQIPLQHRRDVVKDNGAIAKVVSRTGVDRMPWGRWPSNPEHHLALSQQFAVDEAIETLGPAAGLMGVNGPPGTGKSTLLREIVAANVVARAQRMARLQRPDEIFQDPLAQWKSEDGYPREVLRLHPDLTGFEMVVASSNNGAVENISNELPASAALDSRWKHVSAYFAKTATDVLQASGATLRDASAWGLIAARLGKKDNRDTFIKAFWLGTANPASRPATPLRELLGKGAPRTTTWEQAVDAFRTAEKAVEELLAPRLAAQRRLEDYAAVRDRARHTKLSIEEGTRQRRKNAVEYEACVQRIRELNDELAAVDRELADHSDRKPSWWYNLWNGPRDKLDWDAGKKKLDESREEVAKKRRAQVEQYHHLHHEGEQIAAALTQATSTLTTLRKRQTDLQTEMAADDNLPGYPGVRWTEEQQAARALRAPWLDEELNIARSELFLAALDLQRVFLERTDQVFAKLNAAVDVVWGKAAPHLSAEAIEAAWQLFFLVVPVVSTTFASFASSGAMFSSMRPESLGWLLIDEAGQVKPQEAIGAIWRSRRVVSVGDPRQLQPIVTMPPAAEETLARAFGISETWMPSRTSVQGVSDRTGLWGTYIGDKETDKLWIGAPLLVHRRCDEPMFSICNHIAYGGIMIQANTCDCTHLPQSSWIDVPNPRRGTRVQDNEITALVKYIDMLADEYSLKRSEIFVVSPFRPVVDRINDDVFAVNPQMGGGTVHSVQGQQAKAVILVLGGDPNKRSSKEWAGNQPNLLNVAVSRAEHRFYVIGDRARWSTVGHFRHLAAKLSVTKYAPTEDKPFDN